MTNREREVKLLIRDYDKVKEIIVREGFKYTDTCFEEDYYYSHPCIDFSASDEALRARRRRCSSSEYYVITYKGPRLIEEPGLKTRLELEVELTSSQWDVIRSIIEKLGFNIIAKVSKIRELYTTPCVNAYLDKLLGVGFYFELEIKCESGEELIKRILVELSNYTQLVHETYLEICLKTKKCI